MKLSSGLGLAGLGLFGAFVAVSSASMAGCSNSTTSTPATGDDGSAPVSGDTCGSTGVSCTVQPPAPSGGSPTSAKHNYAVHTLHLGGADRTGVASNTAWESYGYNLDNLVTTKTSTDVCTLASGAAKTTQVDGNGGIDNSFGANIWPIVETTAGTQAEQTINASIQAGHFTVMAYVVGFDDTVGNSTSATGLTGALFSGGNYATANNNAAPTWDLNTHWPIAPGLISGCTATGGCPAGTDPIANATIKFPAAYQAAGTFVNGTPANLSLTLAIQGQSLTVNVSSAIMTFIAATGGVSDGTIAGTIVASDLVTQLQGVAGSISTSLCSGSAFDSIAQQILQAADIVIDGSGNVSNTAGASCNGISIGIGFEATEIALPVAADVEGPQAPPPNPCTDDGGAAGDGG